MKQFAYVYIWSGESNTVEESWGFVVVDCIYLLSQIIFLKSQRRKDSIDSNNSLPILAIRMKQRQQAHTIFTSTTS